MTTIDKKTTISIGLLLSILVPAIATAVAWGVIFNKVDNLEDQMGVVVEKVDRILIKDNLTLEQ
jgi:ABC-type spermidine/putrescine transport system permease subunit II